MNGSRGQDGRPRNVEQEKIPGPADRRRKLSECEVNSSKKHCIQKSFVYKNRIFELSVERGETEQSWPDIRRQHV